MGCAEGAGDAAAPARDEAASRRRGEAAAGLEAALAHGQGRELWRNPEAAEARQRGCGGAWRVYAAAFLAKGLLDWWHVAAGSSKVGASRHCGGHVREPGMWCING